MSGPHGAGGTPGRRPSATHDRAVLRQDNGELEEDVLSKDALDTAGTGHPGSVDEETVTEDPRHGNASDRVVDRSPVDHVPERRNPDDPVPRTLPRD